MPEMSRLRHRLLRWCLVLLLGVPGLAGAQDIIPIDEVPAGCSRLLYADVVAIDQVFFWNRLGAVQPQGMMFALRHDVVSSNPLTTRLVPGQVQLRSDKRPRPLVLRMNVGDCLRITFENLLSPGQVDEEQPATRWASVHAIGMQLVGQNTDDGSFVGQNPNGLVDVGQSTVYTLYADREGEHLLYSMGTTSGGEGDGGQINSGLFGAIVVEPAGARWYRSQVTRSDLALATAQYVQGGYPVLNYEAVYPTGHPRAGLPILSMLDSKNNIIHSDLTAIISGSPANQGGSFPTKLFPANVYTYPRRFEPFREFTIIYHDEIGAVQAFPQFEQDQWRFTLHSGRDGFAINYGTGGVGAEVLANRLGVGPMWDCVDCKFEEFFLTSWAVGDPAMVVDVPANAPCMVSTNSPNSVSSDPNFQPDVQGLRDGTPCAPAPGRKATRAFYPDDPSNVYHSYLADHTRYRVMHAGSKEHHIHHLHAHQWLYTADSDTSSYLDSQALGPGASFTAEIAYEGSGNRNLTAGDSIFHCHFYPHFAQGMWALWRVHDVLELGTPLDDRGRPMAGGRALPDGEIAAGTPIPAVVPLPGKAMAPLPGAAVSIVNGQVQVAGAGHPGYPFFVPGVAGHRPPSPPLDVVDSGGLERHVVTGGAAVSTLTPLDFSKDSVLLSVNWLPETGTPVETAAMAFHAQPSVPTVTPGGAAASFKLNGRAPVQGAPFADPCPTTARPIRYQGADIQLDVTFNKKGWHFGQERISSLWQDVNDFIAGIKPPEPLFFRANSEDCIRYEFTNLVPDYYEQDDFEVRTPTDILGQHIHLVKFDVLASDGGGNGFNYEDGSLSPGEVRQRINAIRAQNGCAIGAFDPEKCPQPQPHPFFGAGPKGEWLGAQTTVQRWWADPVQDNAGNDRTLRTVFTHDHYGPSTHQQAGLYAGLVIEEKDSRWYHNETGAPLGVREDGGPTSWQAVIEGKEVFREFLFEFGDFQQAYWGKKPVNPPGKEEILLGSGNDLLQRQCPNGAATCPELVSADESGTMVINYRNEPLAFRVRNPATNGQATGDAGDLSLAFSSSVTRADGDLNVQPNFYPPLTEDVRGGDPYTPILRAYENDRVHIRNLVGAHEEGHNFSIHGIKWLFEPSETDSGYRNSQMMGISEHYEFIVPQLIKNSNGAYVDRLYSAGSSTDDLWNGLWGIFRTYSGTRQGLRALSTNPNGRSNLEPGAVGAFDFSCPKAAPVRPFDVTAVSAATALPNGAIVYNSRTDGAYGILSDPTGILYARTSDLTTVGGVVKLKKGAPVEPLVLRARAGECIQLTLRNALPTQLPELDGYNTLPMIVEGFNANDIRPSSRVGLHPQLVYYDVSRYDGADIGGNSSVNGNATQTVAPGFAKTYQWYAGDVFINPDGSVTPTPIEFGATNLISSDRIEHASKGAIGALIIEPASATWTEDCSYDSFGNPVYGCTRASATVANPAALASQDASFREFVLQFQNDVNLRMGGLTADHIKLGYSGWSTSSLAPGYPSYGIPVRSLGVNDDAEDSGQKALNYRTEPLWKRMQYAPEEPTTFTRDLTDWWDVVSNSKVGDPPDPRPAALPGDPVTPVFRAQAGNALRFRVLQSGGHSRNEVFTVHGHVWDKEPYIADSTKIGRNSFSFWEGARYGHGPTNHFDAVVRNGAGGAFHITGDYLFRDFVSVGFDNGLWGILRVE